MHPAIYDSGGIAPCEAMACGLPGVSFDLPALRTYYPKGMLKAPCYDLKAFAENILALRFFNVYGPRQSLRNPYTGVAAIFLSRLLNNKPPYILEDSNQTRDFVHVKDVARAVVLAVGKSGADYLPVNIGAGRAISIREVTELLTKLLGLSIKPIISNKFRKGDVRHCFADISRARSLLGYEPKISIERGFSELVAWAKEHKWESIDLFDQAIKELEERRLT